MVFVLQWHSKRKAPLLLRDVHVGTGTQAMLFDSLARCLLFVVCLRGRLSTRCDSQTTRGDAGFPLVFISFSFLRVSIDVTTTTTTAVGCGSGGVCVCVQPLSFLSLDFDPRDPFFSFLLNGMVTFHFSWSVCTTA